MIITGEISKDDLTATCSLLTTIIYSSNTTPTSIEDSSMGINYTTLNAEPISKRIASPINGGQSKGSSNGGGVEQPRSQRNNGGNRTNGTTQSTNNNNNNNNLTSSSYDTVMAGSVDDGFRESLSKNGSTKGGFR